MTLDPTLDPTPAPHRPRRRLPLLLIGVAAVVLVLDQLTKALVISRLAPGESWPADPAFGLLSLSHVHNTGVAFGLFQGNSDFLIVVSAIIVAVLLAYQHNLPGGSRLMRLAIGLQIGGAIGNVIDRVRLGHVTDFFKVGWWPVFNVADSAIVVGVLLLAFELWREERARIVPAYPRPEFEGMHDPAREPEVAPRRGAGW
jgi:signal peptidase II